MAPPKVLPACRVLARHHPASAATSRDCSERMLLPGNRVPSAPPTHRRPGAGPDKRGCVPALDRETSAAEPRLDPGVIALPQRGLRVASARAKTRRRAAAPPTRPVPARAPPSVRKILPPSPRLPVRIPAAAAASLTTNRTIAVLPTAFSTYLDRGDAAGGCLGYAINSTAAIAKPMPASCRSDSRSSNIR